MAATMCKGAVGCLQYNRLFNWEDQEWIAFSAVQRPAIRHIYASCHRDCGAGNPLRRVWKGGHPVILKIGKKTCDFCHMQILPKEKWQTSGMLVYHVSCWEAFRTRERNVFKESKK
jgi:hypothetical protein